MHTCLHYRPLSFLSEFGWACIILHLLTPSHSRKSHALLLLYSWTNVPFHFCTWATFLFSICWWPSRLVSFPHKQSLHKHGCVNISLVGRGVLQVEASSQTADCCSSIFNLLGNFQTDVLICTPASREQGLLCPHLWSDLLMWAILSGVRCYPKVVLICFPLMTRDAEYF